VWPGMRGTMCCARWHAMQAFFLAMKRVYAGSEGEGGGRRWGGKEVYKCSQFSPSYAMEVLV